MTIFAIDPEQQKGDAEQRLKSSQTLLGLAVKAYEKDPSKVNGISLKAAKRLLEESKAQLAEWQT